MQNSVGKTINSSSSHPNNNNNNNNPNENENGKEKPVKKENALRMEKVGASEPLPKGSPWSLSRIFVYPVKSCAPIQVSFF